MSAPSIHPVVPGGHTFVERIIGVTAISTTLGVGPTVLGKGIEVQPLLLLNSTPDISCPSLVSPLLGSCWGRGTYRFPIFPQNVPSHQLDSSHPTLEVRT
jgi:hypothetical protein